ncbi:MAG: DUF5789 family protein [Halodesulfurarchaeum sp.]
MADDKRGRDKQAHDADIRQRERAIETELSRGDEPAPPLKLTELSAVAAELEALKFPVTGAEIVATIGDRELSTEEGNYTIEELLPATDEETFDSSPAVEAQIQRPTIAVAMKRVVEATKSARITDFSYSQRKAYEKTFEALKVIDAVDNDEGIEVMTDWILEQISEEGRLPTSRNVRREAVKYCRANGYQVRNDEWLGI